MIRNSIFSGLALMRVDIPRPLSWKRWKTDVIDICFATTGLLALLFSPEKCDELYGEEVTISVDPGDAVHTNAAGLLNHKYWADKFKEFESNSKDLRNAIAIRFAQAYASARVFTPSDSAVHVRND